MEEPKSRRSCVFCRSQRIKCGRSLPTCHHCQKTDRACVYPDQSSLKIHDQTDEVASRAVRLWRSRAHGQSVGHAHAPRPRLDVSVPAEALARQRFMYDFAGFGFVLMLRDSLAGGEITPDCSGAQGCLDLALDAVALTNFSRRHNDQRIVELATRKHRQAVSRLRESLGAPSSSAFQSTAAAVLLGLHQSFNHDPDLAGSWVHHFRGAISLLSLLEPDVPQRLHILRLIAKQAAHTSARMCVLIHLPSELQAWLQSEISIDSRAASLLYRTDQLCFCDKNKSFRLQRTDEENLSEAFALRRDFENLEIDMHREIPSQLRRANPLYHAAWWRPFSSHAGSPRVEHVYLKPQDAGIWNTYRTGRLTLIAWALWSQAEFVFDMTQAALVEHGARLIDDICGSLYYLVTQPGHGYSAAESFDAIPGSVGYGLHLIFLKIRDLLSNSGPLSSLLLERVGHERLVWIEWVLEMFSERLGITEALLWEEGDEVQKQAALNRLVFEE